MPIEPVQGSPKLAVETGSKYISADCGTLICGSGGGYIQTTGNGSGKVPGTPILRDIQLVRGEVSIPHLLEDLFWLSKIHGGSTRQPGLPIPQAYAHKLTTCHFIPKEAPLSRSFEMISNPGKVLRVASN